MTPGNSTRKEDVMDGFKKKKKGSGMKSMREPHAVSCSCNRNRTPGNGAHPSPLLLRSGLHRSSKFWLQHLKSYVRTGMTLEKDNLNGPPHLWQLVFLLVLFLSFDCVAASFR